MNQKPQFALDAKLGEAQWFTAIQDSMEWVEELLHECVASAGGKLKEIASHILSSGGKRLRPILTLLSGWVMGNINERTIAYAAAIELIHAASLLHDDVIDGARVRRGRATANALWGDSAAIVGGDFLIAWAFNLLSRHADERVMQDIAETAQKMCHGQMLELSHAFDVQMTSERYLEIIRLKTAELFASACFAGSLSAGAAIEHATHLRSFGLLIGMTFQIVDDLLDLIGSESKLGKPIGQDLRGGKITLPLIELLKEIRKDGESAILRQVGVSLNERNVCDELIITLREFIISYGIDKRIRLYARQLADDAIEILKLLPTKRCGVLSSFARFIVDREL
ncbi:MAG: polyprenyl synthetase family protein [Armatimonadota bacterium]|nr:polyprenyl synthetase family protein [Armatimonadota bacterium]MCX7776981.1 polyprenyl synthetase family protein [Armatimonadota bacterium]MDW8024815.1 polyprenyl synthetase family protein [Armatimonadota bacterium]